jgi:hypothetical protein
VLLDEQELALDLIARGVLLRRVEVLDELEDEGEARQVEHQHHHALDAGGDAERVAGVAQVVEQVAVEQVLAVLLQADGAVELAARLPGHQAAQELHGGRGHLDVDHEVGAREAEQHQQIVLAEQHGVDDQFAACTMQDGQRERRLVEAVDDLADHVGALVAEEQRGDHLHLEIGAPARAAHLPVHRGGHMGSVARRVLEGGPELEVGDDAAEGLAELAGLRVVGAVGRLGGGLVVLDVLGADGRTHEQEVVVEVAVVQDARAHRVEEGLGQLGLQMVGEQADVVQLDLLPHVHRQVGGLVAELQQLDVLANALVVEGDALGLRRLLPAASRPARSAAWPCRWFRGTAGSGG